MLSLTLIKAPLHCAVVVVVTAQMHSQMFLEIGDSRAYSFIFPNGCNSHHHREAKHCLHNILSHTGQEVPSMEET